MIFLSFFIFLCAPLIRGQIDLGKLFEDCRLQNPDINDCLKDGFNKLTPYFPEGLPEYGIEKFDPFFASEVPFKRSTPFLNINLILRNVTESGWTLSNIKKVKMNLENNEMSITQTFPDKRLNGWYELQGNIFNNKIKNSGAWNLSLFDYVQTLTVSRNRTTNNPSGSQHYPIIVKCKLESCKNLKLHITNLARGRTIIENILDRVINTAWQPGFVVLSPVINELVGTAFTEIFNRNFQYFPIENIIPN